jgi:hypothetical protein
MVRLHSPNIAAGTAQPVIARPLTRGGYDVARPGGVCHVTKAAIEPGRDYFAALREADDGGFERLDVLPEAWEDVEKGPLLAFWQTTMPEPNAKRRVFVDDAALAALFHRLDGADSPERLNFRFVLGLILIRKRLIAHEGVATDDQGRTVWQLRWRGRNTPAGSAVEVELVDPGLSEAEVEEIAGSMSEVLNAEL